MPSWEVATAMSRWWRWCDAGCVIPIEPLAGNRVRPRRIFHQTQPLRQRHDPSQTICIIARGRRGRDSRRLVLCMVQGRSQRATEKLDASGDFGETQSMRSVAIKGRSDQV